MGILVLSKFDPGATYVARKPMVVDGNEIAPGDPLPEGINGRRLRQLYEARLIVKAAQEAPYVYTPGILERLSDEQPVVEEQPVDEQSVVEEQPVDEQPVVEEQPIAPVAPVIPVPTKLKTR